MPEDRPSRRDKPPRDEDASFYVVGLRYSAVAFEFVAMIAVLGYIGYRLDEKYDTDPWLFFGGLLLGMGLGLFTMVRQLSKLNR